MNPPPHTTLLIMIFGTRDKMTASADYDRLQVATWAPPAIQWTVRTDLR